ncbi:interferon-induced protein with tetratricopeptide repeats 2-like [Kryptolebias marmoratus]|uniref:Interferon-induced protein with tetratricopeptide repeats 2-like n=1 Tax=Kryptolebias marmoratus TaxID=37003 RepID=A0A3Q3FP86_KRYMA|nr:interferon-induced protein with tetratricopeptide repeats 2-like [Kryptolebias marmoratus]
MSSQSLESKLEALQSHFTWDLDPRRSKLFRLKDNLEDIGTEEDNIWLGPIYNLQGFIHYKLGFMEEARAFFSRATEAFQQLKTTDEGPWLVVNYGNLAWLHHHTGEDEKRQDFLSKVDALMNKYPAPIKGELHPEVCAEKAWTLMKFDNEKKLQAAEYFQKAIRMEPNRKEWRSNYILLKLIMFKEKTENLEDDLLAELKSANEEDPENLYLEVLHMEACAAKGIKPDTEAVQNLAGRVLSRPASSYNGLAPLLRLCREFLSVDEAVGLAEEALRRHPEARSVKACAAVCYKYKVYSQNQNPDPRTICRATDLFKKLIEAYPHSLLNKLTLASLYAKYDEGQADQIFEDVLGNQNLLEDLDPTDTQMLYHFYANHLFFIKKKDHESIKYHMKVVEIQHESHYREKSIRELEKNVTRIQNSGMCEEVREFMEKLNLNV